jgi:hypothetical protein
MLNSRNTHWPSEIAIITIDTYAKVWPLVFQHSHRPRTDEIISQGAAVMPNKASNVPPIFARKAPDNSPCIKITQAVVMPHVGHGTPNNTKNVQGGKPNC